MGYSHLPEVGVEKQQTIIPFPRDGDDVPPAFFHLLFAVVDHMDHCGALIWHDPVRRYQSISGHGLIARNLRRPKGKEDEAIMLGVLKKWNLGRISALGHDITIPEAVSFKTPVCADQIGEAKIVE